jgi:hypothetical protein
MQSTIMCDCLANLPDEQLFFEDRKGYATCVICMELIKENNQTTLECGHQYHASCYSENILSGNNHCALCREEVCREADQLPNLNVTMVTVFIEQMLIENKGRRITQLFQELGYDINKLNRSDYQCVIRILFEFGFHLGSKIRVWTNQGNQRYVDNRDPEEYLLDETDISFIPDNIIQQEEWPASLEEQPEEEGPATPPPTTISDTGSDTGGDPVPQEAPPSTNSDPVPQEAPPSTNSDSVTQEAPPSTNSDPVPQEAPPSTNSDSVTQEAPPSTNSEPVPQEDDVSYEELYDHLIQRDRRFWREFLERFNLQAYEERLLGHEAFSTLESLLSCQEEDLMWPDGWSGRRPYFTSGESQEIVGGILRYYSEVYDGSYNGMYGLL